MSTTRVNAKGYAMPWKQQVAHALTDLLPVFIALIAGMLGGATVASSHLLARRIDRLAYGLAYVIIGAGFGAAIILTAPLIPVIQVETLTQAAGLGLFASLIGVTAVAAGNFSVAFLFKRLGLSVHVQVRGRGGSQWSSERRESKDDEPEDEDGR